MKKILPGLIIYAYFGVFFLITAGLGAYWQRYKAPPPQPIHFPHVIHVSKVGLKCMDCHQYAAKAAFPGMPPISKCMSCHRAVATSNPQIQKLTGYWKRKQPIAWSRIHELPSFVYFSHKRHVKAGIACQTCHGQVQAMYQVRKVHSLTMGWCISCHRDHGCPTDCYTCHK